MPGLLGPYARFRERFELPIVGGDEDIARRLQALVGPFMLRRLKTQVLSDLPEKLESVVYAPMTGEQLKLYSAYEQRFREELTRQKSDKAAKDGGRKGGMSDAEFNKSKVNLGRARVCASCAATHLLYENYKGTCSEARRHLRLGGLCDGRRRGRRSCSPSSQASCRLCRQTRRGRCALLPSAGAAPRRSSSKLVNRFNADDTPVFLISLKAGGTGLSLTGCVGRHPCRSWWNAAQDRRPTARTVSTDARGERRRRVIAKGAMRRILALQEAALTWLTRSSARRCVARLAFRDDLVDLTEPVE